MAEEQNIGYEKKDINVRFVIGISLISIIIFVFILVLLSDYFIATESEITYETQAVHHASPCFLKAIIEIINSKRVI